MQIALDHERAVFMQALADYLHGSPTGVPVAVDWPRVVCLARYHQVEGILYRQCRDCLPGDLKQTLANAYAATLFTCINRREVFREVSAALRGDGVPFFTVKGFAVAQYYPIPELRTMGDCDLIVPRDSMPAAMAVMRGMGCTGVRNDFAHDWECVKDGMLFELHDGLVQQNEHATPSQISFFNDHCLEYVRDGELDWNFHFLYLLMHLRKHFMNSGVGVRQFMDLAVIIQRGPALDWQWIENQLSQLHLLKFALSCFALIQAWFGIDPPLEAAALDPEFVERVTDRILDNGVFGFQNEGNRGNYERNVLIKSGRCLFANRLKLLWQKTFPPYKYMCAYPGTSYVSGRPYMLPVAWCHRYLLYADRGGNKSTIKRIIHGSLTGRRELDEQRYFLDNMGL